MKYFAYGSNMDAKQLANRVGEAPNLGVGSLIGYQFRINGRGVATIATDTASTVHGVVWELSTEQLAEMDRFEGVRKGCYVRSSLSVRIGDANVDCEAYIAADKTRSPAHHGYLETIIAAARAAGLPQSYIEELCTWTRR